MAGISRLRTTDDDLYWGTVRRCAVARLVTRRSIRFGRYSLTPSASDPLQVECSDKGRVIVTARPFDAVRWFMGLGWE